MLGIGTQNGQFNCQEVYSVWDLVASKYLYLNNLAVYKNVVHDKDLLGLVNQIFDATLADVKQLETKLSSAKVASPDVGVIKQNTAYATEASRDQTIARNVFLWLQGDIECILRAMRTATTNDDLRSYLLKLTRSSIDRMNSMVKFMRSKAWINDPPLYPNIPQTTKEVVDVGEAFHLWDHLTFRYDTIAQTAQYQSFAHDTELKLLLTVGLTNILEKEAEKLEKVLLKFGIPLPTHPANVAAAMMGTPEAAKDDYIYRAIYIGIIGATLLHASAVKQCTTNDNVRRLFTELLFSEMGIQTNFIKYGKLKGYLSEPPRFNPKTS